jgi:transcription termination factor Rho
VTETIEPTSSDAANTASAAPKKRSGGLNTMLLADLKSMAGGLGIRGVGSMKKAQLVEAIKAAQSGGQSGGQPAAVDRRQRGEAKAEATAEAKAEAKTEPKTEPKQASQQDSGRHEPDQAGRDQAGQDQGPQDQSNQDRSNQDRSNQDQGRQRQGRQGRQDRDDRNQNAGRQERAAQGGTQEPDRQDRQQQNNQNQNQNQNNQGGDQGAYEDGGSRRSRRRRGRDRDRDRGGNRPQSTGQRNEPDTTILEDDVLTPAAGILDVLDNYAFVRTSGYLPGTDDVYVSLSMVRKYGLRRGDAIVGQVRQPREGERKEKFNPMVRIDSVNGADPEASKNRVDFAKLTPLYPSERLRLETEPTNLIGRVIDIASPIGKGQRGLIVSPSKAGKTMIMQSIAASIMTNNPECHLMVVLVDERPEEVTDFERSTKGEVISSTFDRPASDHTIVAELAIERAKRLVELGHDVVVLLDGITRLGRAYNLAAPASGRILSGGVDSAALYPPKRFFGAARNIENGGSLTILATALIESGSKMDEVIFEEFKGTGNMEIRLRRDFADKRLFPAIDAVQSGTRREELLMSKEELAIVWKLRRVLSALDGQQALELLLERLKKSQSNIEFLMQVQKTTPGAMGGGD